MSEYTDNSLLTVNELAKYLNVEPGTIYGWSGKGRGPKKTRLSGTNTTRYLFRDVLVWLRNDSEAGNSLPESF